MPLTDRTNSHTRKDADDCHASRCTLSDAAPPSDHVAQLLPVRDLPDLNKNPSPMTKYAAQWQPPEVLLPSTYGLTSLTDDDSDVSETDSFERSITQRRRHAVYFHRPPVWVPCQHLHPTLSTVDKCAVSRCLLLNSIKDKGCCGCCHSCVYKEQLCGRCPGEKNLSPCVASSPPRSVSEVAVGSYEEQLKFLDTKHVEEPFIVAMANVENGQNGPTQQLGLDGTLTLGLPGPAFLPASYPSGQETSTEPPWDSNLVKLDSGSEASLLSLRQALGIVPSKGNNGQSTDSPQEEDKGGSPLMQKPAEDCTRLKLYKDIRLGPDETWAMHEGSLVICIDPVYTIRDHDVLAQDVFDLVQGDVYVVCRMYADMWALCAKISFHSPIEAAPTMAKNKATPKGAGNLAFLPLCSVTLAANFSAFNKRCSEYRDDLQKTPTFPGNGLRVKPPQRTHSLNASHEIFQESRPHLRLPNTVFEVCNSFSSEKSEKGFTGLDNYPQQTASKIRSGLGQLDRRMTFRKMWTRLRSSESSASADLDVTRKPLENPLSPIQTASSQGSQEVGKGRGSHESSDAGEDTKQLTVTTRPEGDGKDGKRRKSVRDFIFGGEERSRRGSDRRSAQSEASIINENLEF